MFRHYPPLTETNDWWDVMLKHSCFGPHINNTKNNHDIVADDIYLAEDDFLARRAHTWDCEGEGYLRGFIYDDELILDFGRPWQLFAEHAATLAELLERPLVLPQEAPGVGEPPHTDILPVTYDTRRFVFDRTHPTYRVSFPQDGLYSVYVLDPADL